MCWFVFDLSFWDGWMGGLWIIIVIIVYDLRVFGIGCDDGGVEKGESGMMGRGVMGLCG